MASNPWQGHNNTALFTILLVGAAILISLIGYLASRLARETRRQYTPITAWRDASLLAAAAALAVYLWGCLHVVFLEDQEQAEACELHRPAGTPTLVGRRGDFIPLRLVCEASNGHDYSVVIPGYINPSVATLLLLALAGALTAAVLHYKQRTTTRKKG
ncbi:hypothetical protein [Streptomyces sp. BPTC-684]|uniref:hypothetical protein n=1 Tax=Streptomyces sp. BPTC-684 TaxID=3043734 RepID=UPI0024B046FF|nr:hypothetical protein [Streptomyces sp. BPTC-684]WHM37438.1 hypothetical protein QIY60_11330 [Streptomyces sp. BPTC-684]